MKYDRETAEAVLTDYMLSLDGSYTEPNIFQKRFLDDKFSKPNSGWYWYTHEDADGEQFLTYIDTKEWKCIGFDTHGWLGYDSWTAEGSIDWTDKQANSKEVLDVLKKHWIKKCFGEAYNDYEIKGDVFYGIGGLWGTYHKIEPPKRILMEGGIWSKPAIDTIDDKIPGNIVRSQDYASIFPEYAEAFKERFIIGIDWNYMGGGGAYCVVRKSDGMITACDSFNGTKDEFDQLIETIKKTLPGEVTVVKETND